MLFEHKSLFVGAALLTVAGCQPSEEIRSYPAPKETAVVPVAQQAETPEPTDRMIVAIVPDGQRAWFLKVVGPLATVDQRTDEINQFFDSVRVALGKPRPDWKLPEGWNEEEGSGMRAATLSIPTEDEPLEMSVTILPWTGGKAALLSNVNRWRGQLQLPPIGVVALAQCTSDRKAGDTTITIVDLTGQIGDTGMTPPFAQRAGSSASPPGASAPAGGQSDDDLPAGHPPLGTAAPPAANEKPLTYDVPKSWREIPATGMRKAAFTLRGDNGQALLTVIDFPASAGPMMADPLANVNRWRGEVRLPPVDDDGLAEVTETIEIDGRKGTYVDAVPDADQPEQAQADRGTLAAMVADGERIWFFKLTGARDLVAGEKDNFHKFLKSVRFKSDGGATHGDK